MVCFQVTVKNVGDVFWGTQCIYCTALMCIVSAQKKPHDAQHQILNMTLCAMATLTLTTVNRIVAIIVFSYGGLWLRRSIYYTQLSALSLANVNL